MDKKIKFKMIIADILMALLLIFADQITKIWVTPLKESGPIVLINNVFEIRYLENHGAAFGILQGKQIFFLIISVVVYAAIIYVLAKMPTGKRYIPMQACLVFIFAGAVGNTIDRFAFGYVRDFLYFKLIDFPIFNVADIYITCSVIVFALLFLLFYKEEELEFLSLKKKPSSKE